jgi:peptide/nickel transport system substrate-binding protein
MKIYRRAALVALALAALGSSPVWAQAPAQKQTDTLIYLHSIEPKSLFQWWTQATYPKRQILDSLVYLDDKRQLHPGWPAAGARKARSGPSGCATTWCSATAASSTPPRW